MIESINKGTILYIGGFELPDKNAAAQRVLSNAKLFRMIGYKTILLGINKEIKYDTPIRTTLFEFDNFAMYSVPYPKKIKQWKEYLMDINKYIEFVNQINDLKFIICYNFPSIALNKIRKYCSKNAIKCIADITEWYSVSGRTFLIKLVKGIDTFYRMRVVQKKLDALIVISRYLENYYNKCNNVVYIPPLTDFKMVSKENKIRKNDYELKLVYAGNPGVKDCINLLIEALSQVKRKIRLDIIGIDKMEYISLYPAHKQKNILSPNIVFHGRLSHEETVDYIKGADFSCFFRHDNRLTKAGFPTKFSEAISLGIPVLTNKSSNIDEYIIDGINGVLVEDLSINEIAKTLETIGADIIVETETFNYKKYVSSAKMLLE